MLLEAIGAGLPLALAIALSPLPVISMVVIMSGPRGRLTGALFAAGRVLGLTLLTVVVVLVLQDADEPGTPTSAIADWGRVAVGAVLIVLGLWKWRRRPGPGTEVTEPAWMTALGAVGPIKVLGLGFVLALANPKYIVFVASAGAAMVEAKAYDGDLVVSIVVFVLVASAAVLGAAILSLVGGQRGAALLSGIRDFMVANQAVISVVILILLGAKVLGDGLIGLAR